MDRTDGGVQSYQFGEWLVEPALNRVSRVGEQQRLEPLAMDVLRCLLEQPGVVVTNDDLLESLWSDRSGDPSMIKKRIGQIRRALGDSARHPGYIETIRKRGYRVIAPVTALDTASEPATESPHPVRRSSRFALLAGIVTVAAVTGGLLLLLAAPSDPPDVRSYRALTEDVVAFPPVPSPFPLVTDGSVIYFNDWRSGRLGIRRLAYAGGESVAVDSPFEDPETLINPQGLTPDGSCLLILSFTPSASEPDLWTWPIVGGTPKHLGTGGSAVYSPDGRKLLFTQRRRELLLASADMTDQRSLGTVPGAAYWPAFSPDAERVRVSVNNGRSTHILEVAVDGAGMAPLLPDWTGTDHCCGSWTEDGNYYVFQATVNDDTQLWALREGSMQPVRITRTAMQFRRPTIRDAQILAVGWNLRGELSKRDASTGVFAPLPGFESVSAEWLEYSADGEWVAYVSYPEAALWRARSDGRERLRLSETGVRTSHPAWSPDGSMIAYLKWRNTELKSLGLRSRDGKARSMTGLDGSIGPPTWSPDGSSVVAPVADKEGLSSWQVNVAAGSRREVSQLSGMNAPRWSPDGRYFAAFDAGTVYLVDALGSGKQPLLKSPEPSSYRWSADSRYVYVIDPFWMAERRAVKRVSVPDGGVSIVALLGDVKNAWGVAGSWVGIAPDGQPMVLRDLSIHNVYSLEWP